MTITVRYDVSGDNFQPSPRTPPIAGSDYWERTLIVPDARWSGDLAIAFPFWRIQWNLYEAAGGYDAAADWAWRSGFTNQAFKVQRCGLDRVLSGECNLTVSRVTTDYTSPVDIIAHISQMIAPFVAMIPGFGTIASVSLAAAAAIALGDPIDKAAIDIVSDALPVGPIRQTFLSASNFTLQIYNGERADRAALSTTRDLAGVLGGSRGTAAFDAGIAAAQGEGVSDASLALAREHINQTSGFEGVLAFDTGVGIVRNRSAPIILQQIGRDFVFQAAGAEMAALYDAGFALAQGESFQKAGFKFLLQIAQGNDLVEKALNFGAALIQAEQDGIDIKDVLVSNVLDNLAPLGLLARNVKLPDTIDKLLGNGDLLSNLSAIDVGAYLNVPVAVAWAAQAAIKQLEDGSYVVDPEVMAVLQTPSGGSTTTTLKLASASYHALNPLISSSTTMGPSAIQSASALAKPAAATPIVTKIQQQAEQGNVDAILAQQALLRAQRALARQGWIDYYNGLV